VIFRIYPVRDTFITNAYPPRSAVRATGSNLGASEELDVFKLAGVSGATTDIASSSLGRALLQFDLSEFSALTASGDIPVGQSFVLRMNHKTAGCTQPSSFDLLVRPVASGWDEGTGQDVIRLGDLGFANWTKRTSTSFWTVPGGDFATSPTASVHFDTGFEDLEVDVTPIVQAWISSTLANNGVGVTLPASIEADSLYTDYFQKKFYSRQTSFSDRAPYIEVRAADYVRDDRSNMQWGRTGSLWLYNIVGGTYQDLPGNFVTVGISDASGALRVLTASHVGTGLYSASFSLATGSYSGSVFFDSWGSGSYAFLTGNFSFVPAGPAASVAQQPLTARVRNLQDEYMPDELVTFEVMFRRRAHALPVFQTASLGSVPYIVEQAYYAIENDSTRERVVPFGTGSLQHTRLSYGANGNSFRFFMRNLHSGNSYRIVFLVFDQGRQQVIDGGVRFKVA